MICQICQHHRPLTYRRRGNQTLKTYHSVCADCIRKNFAPCTIIASNDVKGYIGPSDWLPGGQPTIFESPA